MFSKHLQATAFLGAVAISRMAAAAVLPPDLVQFVADRGRIALDLSRPASRCVLRHDTPNPVFHGCVDWHSAVEGVWALAAYQWATGDQRYQPTIKRLLDPALLDQEEHHLAADPGFEMPYGRAWFLRLAMDHKRAFQDDLLDKFAADVASSLISRYTAVAPDPTAGAYDSATWALINLYDYGRTSNNEQIMNFVTTQVKAYYMINNRCPVAREEVESGEFMALCTNWAWLVSRILPREEFVLWIERFLPKTEPLTPITHPVTIHQSGLNFSRSWGAWGIYRRTNDVLWLSTYLSHFNQSFHDSINWNEDYYSVGHWVPQFGMLAVIVSYYDLQ